MEPNKEDRVALLKESLFPGDPEWSAWHFPFAPNTGGAGHEENIALRRSIEYRSRGARYEDYLAHISTGDDAGTRGGLALMPSRPMQVPGDAVKFINWAVINSVYAPLDVLTDAAHGLASENIHMYAAYEDPLGEFATTTGVMQLYIFFSEYVQDYHASKALKTIVAYVLPETSREWSYVVPDLSFNYMVQSNWRDCAILPYRGALVDGYGINPLFDFVNDCHIYLDTRSIDENIRRTERDTVYKLANEYCDAHVNGFKPGFSGNFTLTGLREGFLRWL